MGESQSGLFCSRSGRGHGFPGSAQVRFAVTAWCRAFATSAPDQTSGVISLRALAPLRLDGGHERWNVVAEQALCLKGVCVMVSRFASAVAGMCAVVAAACSSNTHSSGAAPKPSDLGTGGSGTDTSPGGTGGGTTGGGECDDSAIASATKPCLPNADPCNLHSGFAGDEYCILPPPEGKGIQIHFGPKSYTDPDEIAKYKIEPGEEFNAYGVANIDAIADHWYNYTQIRMRPGSHHLINQLVQGDNLQEGYT